MEGVEISLRLGYQPESENIGGIEAMSHLSAAKGSLLPYFFERGERQLENGGTKLAMVS
jgi:hypothetical protein